ncbi:transglycosylase family protein [Streptacidiphilus sp. ASG 303]|uniref:transglycosylase family protein n=1 Tax=Streptacidiphilus sp. ASG 303 TaxID=2896847 RepID=UPI0027E16092|nr:transglycosylase family protein [Streptacidiphilus sp. ASG 303]
MPGAQRPARPFGTHRAPPGAPGPLRGHAGAGRALIPARCAVVQAVRPCGRGPGAPAVLPACLSAVRRTVRSRLPTRCRPPVPPVRPVPSSGPDPDPRTAPARGRAVRGAALRAPAPTGGTPRRGGRRGSPPSRRAAVASTQCAHRTFRSIVAAPCTAAATAVTVAASATAAVAAAVLAATPAAAAAPAAPALDDPVWDRLAACESSGNWRSNTGNGFYGGLQILLGTWRWAGGLRFARRPDLAVREEQITVGQEIFRLQGWPAWPACARRLGLLDPFPGPVPEPSPDPGSPSDPQDPGVLPPPVLHPRPDRRPGRGPHPGREPHPGHGHRPGRHPRPGTGPYPGHGPDPGTGPWHGRPPEPDPGTAAAGQVPQPVPYPGAGERPVPETATPPAPAWPAL